MENKKQQQNDRLELARIFEVHTMKKDAEQIVLQPTASPIADNKKDPNEKPVQIPAQKPLANPFLETGSDKVKEVKIEERPLSPFSEKKDTPASGDGKQAASPAQSKNTLHIVMMVFVVVFLIGAVVFGVYVFMGRQDDSLPEELAEDAVLSVDKNDTAVYSVDLPNHFSFDVESPTASQDIATKLQEIADALKQSSIQEPVEFIVSDQKNNPVSFNIFAISTGLIIPKDIMTNLEENFHLYAYNDPTNGVRFGLVVDVRDTKLLQESLRNNENALPEGLSALFGNAIVPSIAGVTFGDSVYNTHPIRYINLNPQESYSIDYTISGQQLVVGTSKDTLRAILDDAQKDVVTSGGDVQ